MPRANKTAQKHKDLHAQIPAGATRVKVIDKFGHEVWREVDEIQDADQIQTNVKGLPIVMRGKPGRKSKAKEEPTPVNAAARNLVERKEKALAQDPLLQTARTSPDSTEFLHQIIIGLGEEVASLNFERAEAERSGKETSHISVRRINGLKAAAETWIRRKDQVGSRSLDLDSPAFQEAIKFILETMQEAMAAMGMQPEMMQTVFAKFSQISKKDSWESEMRARIKKTF